MVMRLAKNKQNDDKKQEETITEITKEKTTEKISEIKDEKKTEDLTEKEMLQIDLMAANERIADLTDTLKRLQAEFENYKKRIEKDNKHMTEYAGAGVIGKVLPIIDTFEIALKNQCSAEEFKKGAELIYAELMSTLKNEGVRKINALGCQFDPNYHDAMLAVEDKKCKKDTVIEVLQEGYMLKDKVLRHSKVKISK